MTEPIKLPPIPDSITGWYTMHNEQIKQWGRLAVEQATADLRERLEVAEYALRSKGYRKSCEIAACNCGDQWAHGGNAEARLRELSSELNGSPVDMNGKTLLTGLTELIERAEQAEAERDEAQAELARLTTQEPVAWVVESHEVDAERKPLTLRTLDWHEFDVDQLPVGTNLYPIPPVKEADK